MNTRSRSGRGMRRAARRAAATVSALLAITMLGACSSGGSADSSSAGGMAATADKEMARSADSARQVEGAGLEGTYLQGRAQIKTGRVSLEAADLAPVRTEVDRLLSRYGGYVDREETVNDSKGRASMSTLEIRVPSQDFEALLADFKGLATATHITRKIDDVTTEVIDVDARVRTAEVSLGRLRKFLGRAASVDAVVRLESEIAEREAELASLRAQQRYLAGQTSLATVSVQMNRTDTPREDDPLASAGFLTGLSNGWQALIDVAVVAATVAGAVLPFALVAALLLVPLALLVRTLRRRRPSQVAPVYATAGAPAAPPSRSDQPGPSPGS